MITQKQIDELREAAKDATPSPWYWNGASAVWRGNDCDDPNTPREIVAACSGRADVQLEACENKYDNAKFIAAANPAVILDLLERLDGLSEALKEISKEEANRDAREENEELSYTGEVAHLAFEKFGVEKGMGGV